MLRQRSAACGGIAPALRGGALSVAVCVCLCSAAALAACQRNDEPGEPEPSEGEGSFHTDTSGVLRSDRPALIPDIIITPPPADDTLCGNGQLDDGETCDPELHVCCHSDCSGARPAGHACRASAGVCDVEEVCDGSAVDCPDDAFEADTTVCRDADGACDLAEVCTGSSAECPSDVIAASATECRAAASGMLCDAAEQCDGENKTCPPDRPAAAGTICSAAMGSCDTVAACDGESMVCPAAVENTIAPENTPCRAANGPCDIAEVCDGVSAACPGDRLQPAAMVCRPATGGCDVAESCTGASVECPADAFAAAGSVCRASAGACDIAENCSGSAAACPADVVASARTVCRPSTGECDATETCRGGGATLCPPDVALADGNPCRSGLGACWDELCCPGATENLGNGCGFSTGEAVVFVTPRDFVGGALGGVEGADTICTDIARAANLAGTFTAWLSNDPQGRMPENAVARVGEGPYLLVDGRAVAVSRQELDRMLDAPIALTEWGESRSVNVWTGTNTSGGGIVGQTCGDWGDSALRGTIGRSAASDPSWTMFEALSCGAPFALYCIQD